MVAGAMRYGPFDIALVPINGAVLTFPHRQPPSPLSAVMTPEQAAVAARLLGAAVAVPIHYGGFELPGVYAEIPDALARFKRAARDQSLDVRVLQPGAELAVGA
ncbi:MAG: hypothetical protein WAU75_16360 [Solirubrobacteraceae bacterium]